jgi:hypothetical protein
MLPGSSLEKMDGFLPLFARRWLDAAPGQGRADGIVEVLDAKVVADGEAL